MSRKRCEDCIHICGADVFRSFTKWKCGSAASPRYGTWVHPLRDAEAVQSCEQFKEAPDTTLRNRLFEESAKKKYPRWWDPKRLLVMDRLWELRHRK